MYTNFLLGKPRFHMGGRKVTLARLWNQAMMKAWFQMSSNKELYYFELC